MSESLQHFYLDKEEPNKACLLALRSIILKQDALVTETIKYGMPCFCYKNKAFCYLWMDKKEMEPYILFVEGKYLDYPQLETGTRSRMKIWRIAPSQDIDIEAISEILQAALDLYRNGIIKTRDKNSRLQP